MQRRGFRVHPLRGKTPLLPNWPQLATTDEERIHALSADFPDANCGVAGGEDVIILDSDRESRLRELAGSEWEAWTRTYSVTSGRPDRVHFYYTPTPEALAFGNRKLKEPGIDGNNFELKGEGAQVVAEGSIHPETGGVYTIAQDLPLMPFPAGLVALLRELHGRANPSGKREWSLPVHDGDGRDDFLIQQAGKLRNAGASEAIIRAHLDELNSDSSVIADPKPAEDLDRIARSAARYHVPADEPTVVIAKQIKPPEAAPLHQGVRPVYPTEVWDGTALGEFAKLCAHDNNIPRKLYAEAFRCCLGAVVGERLSCPVEGALPRSYTVIIAPKGKGKGTAIRRAVRFFSQEWHGTATAPGLLSGARDFIWKPQGIGAWLTAASSVPGMSRLCNDLKNTIEKSPHLTWGKTLPRILSAHEEFKTFLSTLFIEGGVGSGMEGVVCQLWDDVSFNGTATGTREAVYGEMLFSLLAGVTEDDWFDLLSRGNAVGGGLMSRFNLIGTEGEYKNVGRMNPPDFTALQASFLSRVRQLTDTHIRILPTEGADKVISE